MNSPMQCRLCNSVLPQNATVCPNCQSPIPSGHYYSVNPTPPMHDNPFGKGPIEEGDSTGGIIPYKNPKALIAYYLGILSGLPFIGFPIGIVALVLGIMGLRDRKANPVIKGSIHAGIGIGCGGFFMIFWGVVIVAIVYAISVG